MDSPIVVVEVRTVIGASILLLILCSAVVHWNRVMKEETTIVQGVFRLI